jgi:DNA-binding PadR family transcriptional regulator
MSGRWVDLREAAERLGGGAREGTQVAKETELLAWVVLQAANRTQAKGSTVGLVVPSAPEVVYEVGVELPEARLLEVEEYLKDQGYIESVDLGLTRGTYTITPTGLEYLDVSASEPLEDSREGVTEPSEEVDSPQATPRMDTGGTRKDTEMRPQGWIPRRFQMELIDARKQLQEERSEERAWWRRMFGG